MSQKDGNGIAEDAARIAELEDLTREERARPLASCVLAWLLAVYWLEHV